MALKMPGPVALAPSNVFRLNVRVPGDLVARLRGSRVLLPVADETGSAKIGDKVIVSLRTKDPKLARARFAAALATLQAHWEAFRTGPRPLAHKRVVALAGEVYREYFERRVDEYDLDAIAAGLSDHERAVHELMRTPEGANIMSREEAELIVTWLEPRGGQTLAWAHGGDFVSPYLPDPIPYGQAMEDLFGRPADVICARHARAAMVAMTHKTDRNDARGLAQMLRTGWFRQVHVKARRTMELRTLLTTRKTLVLKIDDLRRRRRPRAQPRGILRRGEITVRSPR